MLEFSVWTRSWRRKCSPGRVRSSPPAGSAATVAVTICTLDGGHALAPASNCRAAICLHFRRASRDSTHAVEAHRRFHSGNEHFVYLTCPQSSAGLWMQERYGTAIIHEDVEEDPGDGPGQAYGTVVVAQDPPGGGGYLDAVRMAGEQFASREPSPAAHTSGGPPGGSPQSGYWAAVASASDAGARACSAQSSVCLCVWFRDSNAGSADGSDEGGELISTHTCPPHSSAFAVRPENATQEVTVTARSDTPPPTQKPLKRHQPCCAVC